MKHLTGLGDNWSLYCKPAMLAYNSYATSNLDNLSPFEVAMERKAVLAPDLNAGPTYVLLVPMLKPMDNCRKNCKFSRKG